MNESVKKEKPVDKWSGHEEWRLIFGNEIERV